jgi:hypothetical protein
VPGPLERSVVQVEAVDVDVGLHGRPPSPPKAKKKRFFRGICGWIGRLPGAEVAVGGRQTGG